MVIENKIMSKAQFNLKHKEVLDSFLLKIPLVKPGKMYGHPAYYVGGKLFASLYMDGVCVKVPESLVNKLLKRNEIVPFQPMGRKMREWILIIRKKISRNTTVFLGFLEKKFMKPVIIVLILLKHDSCCQHFLFK